MSPPRLAKDGRRFLLSSAPLRRDGVFEGELHKKTETTLPFSAVTAVLNGESR